MNVVVRFYHTLSARFKFLSIIVFISMITAGLFQVAGVVSIMPFIAVLASPEMLENNQYFVSVRDAVGIQPGNETLIAVGCVVLFMLILSNVMLAFNVWITHKFALGVQRDCSSNLLRYYSSLDYLEYIDRGDSRLTSNIIVEIPRVIAGILLPMLQGATKLITVVMILIMLFVADPMVATSLLGIVGVSFLLIWSFVRLKLDANGKVASVVSAQRIKVTNELLGGFKIIKVLGREDSFTSQFREATSRLVAVSISTNLIGALPKFILEVIAFGGIILIILYMIYQGKVDQILPLVTLYSLSAYRLMPAAQETYQNLSRIKFSIPALELLIDDFEAIERATTKGVKKVIEKPGTIDLNHALEIRNVSFAYPGSKKPVLSSVNLKISAKTAVGLVGFSGSGKSTLIDIILGVLRPDGGSITVDGTEITDENIEEWRHNIGYVPQDVFLSDTSISENVAFGVPKHLIDMGRVVESAKAAALHDFIISDLPGGYDTEVGDRGARLSGGQRQRLGIARALYRSPTVLILDESTSALDSITEQSIVENINKLSEKITVIMIAHRISTLTNCDNIVVMRAGEVVEQGRYSDLINRSEYFQGLSRYSDTSIGAS